MKALKEKGFSCYLFLISIIFCLEVNAEISYPDLMKLSPQELSERGELFLQIAMPDSAMKYFTVLAGSYSEKMSKQDKTYCALAYKELGNSYNNQEDYVTAYNFWMEGLQIAEKENLQDLIPVFYNNIGNILYIFNEPELGVQCYKKGIEKAKDIGNWEDYRKILINITMQLVNNDQLDKAQKYYMLLRKEAEVDTTASFRHYIAFISAQVHEKEGKYDQAIADCQTALDIAIKRNLIGNISSAYSYIANLYIKKNNVDSVLNYLTRNEEFTRRNHLSYHQKNNLLNLSEFYKQCGNSKRSMEYKQAYWELSDSLFNQKKATQVKNSLFSYEIKKNYQEIAQLTHKNELADKEIRYQRSRGWLYFSGMLIAISFLLYVYHQKKKLMQTYRKLFEQNKELSLYKENFLSQEEKGKSQSLLAKESVSVGEDCPFPSRNVIPEQVKDELSKKISSILHETKAFCQTDFNLDKLANLTNSNTSYISQVINEVYDCNFRTLLSKYRIQEAEHLLRNAEIYTNQTIQSIAESVGYKSSWSFTQHFKEITGMTPSIYIRLLKEERNNRQKH